MYQETPVDALIRAVEDAGGQSAMASKLSAARQGEPITAARVWNWVNRDKKAPADFCPDIEELTGIPCEALRPDVNWSVLRKGAKVKRRAVAPDASNEVPALVETTEQAALRAITPKGPTDRRVNLPSPVVGSDAGA